ncbi:hypothetical protein [Blastococcus sp. SYSU D01042]
MRTRVVVGTAPVAHEVRAAAPLARRLRAPVTARAPWLTAVLDAQAARRWSGRPVAVVVGGPEGACPGAAAFLRLRRRGALTAVTLLGDGLPVPPGLPPARLLAADDDAAARLADGIGDLLGSLRGPWSLALAGLPLGDPTARRLAARYPMARMASSRTTRLVDELDGAGPVLRTRDPAEVDRELPALLAAEPDPAARGFLRVAARLHAAAGQLELAVVEGTDGASRGGLLVLLDGPAAVPWWATPGLPGLRAERGAPTAAVTVPRRSWLPAPDVARRLGGR